MGSCPSTAAPRVRAVDLGSKWGGFDFPGPLAGLQGTGQGWGDAGCGQRGPAGAMLGRAVLACSPRSQPEGTGQHKCRRDQRGVEKG